MHYRIGFMLKIVSHVFCSLQHGSYSTKVLNELIKNPYYGKYKKKISNVNEIGEGHLSYTNRIVPKYSSRNNCEIKKHGLKSLKNSNNGIDSESHKTHELKDILKVDKISDMNPEQIQNIWKEYHKEKNVIIATIPMKHFLKLKERSDLFRNFIFPIPRETQYEFFLLEFLNKHAYFTPLIQYQMYKENAPICLKLFHFTELLNSKGIVLMRGEFDPNVVKLKEAQYLAYQIQYYYCSNDENKLQLLQTFNNNPEKFQYTDLISEFEQIKFS